MLAERIPEGGLRDPGEILERFLEHVADLGIEPYPEQEQALLELLAGHHVVLSTPTGSGKSLVALGLHFKALCEGARSFYTAPIKALVSEKFFALCDAFGAENVAMLTGDASINERAPVVCCTTEVLANMALRRGAATDAPYVVLDEFHYYADRARGVAWQIPLIALPDAQFLLMSATVGNTAFIEERLRARSGRDVAHVHSDHRPVPLDFEYRDTPLHETLEAILGQGRGPIYVVNFTQRECAEQAQALTSANLTTRDEKRVLAEELADVRFDTPYGKSVQRFLRHGVGIHHAGLLPKYRLLVERLAQRALLKVVCGTDTLGVGVNIPIRTVVFAKLCKFDGEKVALLRAREFVQIAGRAGRKGFDERGGVVCQAPEHVVANKRMAERAGAAGGKKRKLARRRAPARGFVPWNRDTFDRLVSGPVEPLASSFDVSHGMIVNVMQREDEGGYRVLADLIAACHESEASRGRLRRRAAALFRSLRHSEIVTVTRGGEGVAASVRVRDDLQLDFSLHNTVSLYLVEATLALSSESPTYALEVLSVVEAILQDPNAILQAQRESARRELLARLKAEGVPFEERIRRLDQVTYPMPEADFIHETFGIFAASHPWVGAADVRPKGVAREMVEHGFDFDDYVRRLGAERSEGLLLRYLSEVHNTLVKSVPEPARTDEVIDLIAFLRHVVRRVDTSLVDAWETLVRGPDDARAPGVEAVPFDLAGDPRLLAARVRAEMHGLVTALARGDYEGAARRVRQDPEAPWDAARFARELAPFLEQHGRIETGPAARETRHTLVKRRGSRSFDVFQVLADPTGENLHYLEGEVDLAHERDPEGPLVRLRRFGS